MFGLQTKKIKIEKKSSRGNKYELWVSAALSETAEFAADMHDFKRGFNNRLEDMPNLSIGAPSLFYRLEQKDPNSISKGFELWHLNVEGDKDRLVAVVSIED